MATPAVKLGFTRAATDINEYLEWAKLAERVGADVIGFGDGQELWNELYVSLSLLAATTTTPLLGATVSNPITRSPSLTASALGTLQQYTGGRVFLGIGTGLSALRNIGLKGSSVADLADYVQAVQALTAGGAYEYRGQRLKLNWEPQRVPVWIGARGPNMLRMAGRVADGVIVGGGVTTGDVVEKLLAAIKVGTDEAGRSLDDIDIWWLTRVVVAPSEDEGIDMMRDYLSGYAAHGFENARALAGVPDDIRPKIKYIEQHYRWDEHLASKPGDTGISFNANLIEEQGIKKWLAARFVITGPPEHCIKGLQELIDAGATNFMIPQVLPGPFESTRLLGEQVFPAFR